MMSKAFSTYLDLLRFFAALLVVFAHAAQDGIYTHPFWLDNFGREAVVIFFVLSGLVISSVAARPGESLTTYSIARLSRLYSVVIPAIALSYLVKGVATQLPHGPSLEQFVDRDLSVISLLTPPLFLTESWNVSVQLPWNDPYWSVSYEAWYYIIFGIAFFVPGRAKYLLAAIAAMVAGPRILALFPIWLLGVAFGQNQHSIKSRPFLGSALFVVSIMAIAAISISGMDVAIRNELYSAIPGWWRLGSSQRVITDSVIGLLVAANFIGFRAAEPIVRKYLLKLEAPIRFFAGYTFSIYLFHRPLMKFAALLVGAKNVGFLESTILTAIIVMLCMILGEFTEKRRGNVRKFLSENIFRSVPDRA